MPLNNEFTSGLYFRINSTRREDAGVYYCVATNDVGSIFSDRLVFAVACKYLNEYQTNIRIVDYGSTFRFASDMGTFDDLTEKVVTVESGNAAILELPPIESHPAPDVTWFSSDGTPLYGIKYATTHHTLIILNASENDEGSYRFV